MGSAELWGHSLLAPSLVVVAVLVGTRRGRRRRAWMALAVGMFFHLLIDGLWADPETFFWPFLGLEFPEVAVPYWADVWSRAFSDPVRWVVEGIGLVYLWRVLSRAGFADPQVRADLLKTGRLPEEVTA